MSEISRSVTMMLYGASKVGKSTLAATAPAPRLLLDVETGHRFLPLQMKYWDPLREDPPVLDGTWDTIVVKATSWGIVLKTFQWLQSGKHPFKSLIIDSISELQIKCMNDLVAPTEALKMQQWGELLRHMGAFLRDVRDLTMHPTAPLDAVILTAMAAERDGKSRPYLQGQLATQAPYFYDVLGALTQETFPHPDPTQPPYTVRRLYVERTDQYEAGERVQGRLGSIVEQSDLNVERMLDMIYGPIAPITTAATAA